MRNAKVSEVGQAKAVLAVAARYPNNELGLQVRAPHDFGGRQYTLLLDVTRAHSSLHRDDTVIATVEVKRGAILRLAEQIKAEDEQRAAAIAYQRERMDENRAAGLPLLTGAEEYADGRSGYFFPPRN